MDDNDDIFLTEPVSSFQIHNNKPTEFITFLCDGEKVGGIKFIDGIISFEGKVDASAKVFFSTLIEHLQLYIESEINAPRSENDQEH